MDGLDERPALADHLPPDDGPTGYEVWSVGGHLTEVLHIPATQPGPVRNVLVFIPGNPGIIGYYHDYLETLHRLSGGNIEVFGCTYPGQSQYLANHEQRVLSLDEQVQHKIAFYDAVSRRVDAHERAGRAAGLGEVAARPRVFLAGHSLGTYVILQLLKHRPTARIDKILALFPTLHSLAKTPMGRQMSWVVMPGVRHTVYAAIAGLRSLVPVEYLRAIVAAVTGHKGRALGVTSRLVHPHSAASSLYLGACEMAQIREMQHDVIERHADKFMFYYGSVDDWCPTSHYDEMRDTYPESKTHLCEHRVPHAFVIEHSELIAEQTAKWLQPFLLQ
ncbi:hypothetical protein HK105_203155 [Polyrhizophydium stewartii]|uniref:Lipid droplet-associated serine hydrolase n=1 Tax=Polyrhizophydium stewartii TaxID=2732419 RepID=A0ABR4NC73_9FUNG|nr:hypothetical protein HK105_006203 [Polyrhizophydium stewartii]